MSGESPLSMMRSAPPRLRKRPAKARRGAAVAHPGACRSSSSSSPLGLSWGWYLAASIADRTLGRAGWSERPSSAGSMRAVRRASAAFPFRIVTRCDKAAATFNSNNPPFDLTATGCHLLGRALPSDAVAWRHHRPVTLADPGQPPIFVANWSRAQLDLLGLPPEPARHIREPHEAAARSRRRPRHAGMIFQADSADVDGRIIQGSARSNPVIEATGHFDSGAAPSFHPLLAAPLQGDIDAVMRGFKDFSPKPWRVLFREMQASGGDIDIKSFRIARTDAIVLGTGNADRKRARPARWGRQRHRRRHRKHRAALGIDQLIGQGIDKLTGGSGSPDRGLNALDRLVPGLSGVVRSQTNSNPDRQHQKYGPADRDRQKAGRGAAAARGRRRDLSRHHSGRRGAGAVLR